MLPALPLVVVLAALVLVFALLRRTSPAVVAPTWISGQPQDDRLAWSSAGFTKPLRLVLEPLLRPERAVTTVSTGALVQSIEYRSVTPHLFDTLIFSPLERVSLRGAHVARRLQSGSLRMYVAYLLVLVLGLLAAARLGLIG
jgi:hydrogenase-4 component B